MKVPLLDLWLRIRASYWFVPALMVVAAAAASLVLVQLEPAARSLLEARIPSLFESQPRGVQALLSTIAGSMITVAGVTFSMTLLALSHATAQLGPGLLAGFMRDRGNQFTLGTFVATFVYCLLVLRTAQDANGAQDQAAMIPHIATLGALALAFASVGVLIYFFHHVPQSINVDRLIANVGDELVRSIHNTYPERSSRRAETGDDLSPDLIDGAKVPTGSEGYLRVVDRGGLAELASDRDLVVRILARPGEYLLPDQAFFVTDAKALDADTRSCLLECVSVGFDRTPEQDILLSAERLLEIMGKALSPGINNQQTATHCVDQLFRGMAEALRRAPPDRVTRDAEGRVRVVTDAVPQEDFVRAICRPMRQYVAGDWVATRHVLRRFDALLSLDSVDDERLRSELIRERDAIVAEAGASDMPKGLQQVL